MAKKKLQRFAEIETFTNVFKHLQHGKTVGDMKLKGSWRNKYFINNNPIVLELGCGKGEYTVGLAERFPNKNFIGIDLKGNRIWRGAKTALDKKLQNVAFLRTRIENIECSFDPGEVNEIWITFPDPQPQESRIKKRLTSPRFLNYYRNLLQEKGLLHLKTDNLPLHEYTLDLLKSPEWEVLDHTADLYGDGVSRDSSLTEIKTHYETKFSEMGFKICYLRWKKA